MKTNDPAVPHRHLQDPPHRTNGRLGGMSPGIPAVRGVRWASLTFSVTVRGPSISPNDWWEAGDGMSVRSTMHNITTQLSR